MQCFEQRLSLKLLLRRLVCILLMICMLPTFEIQAGAATTNKEDYQWVLLISKVPFKYTYQNGKMTAYDFQSKKNIEMKLSGGYWVGQGQVAVKTDYSNTTVPTVAEWKNTKFKYTGTATPYDTKWKQGDNWYWAGNTSGGTACSITTDPEIYRQHVTPAKEVNPPGGLSGNGTVYYITPQIKKNDAEVGVNKSAANSALLWFKSEKPLPTINGGGGGGTDPDPEPEETTASADLSIKANDVSVNYKKFSVEGRDETSVTFDPTDSSTNADWTKYVLSGSDGQGWKMNETYDGRPRKKSFPIEFTKESLKYKGGLGSATVDVRGSVKVYADGDGGSASDSANANTTYTVKFVNNEPVAAIDKVSTLPLANAGSKYDTTFYYVNKPVRITDGSYDPEYQAYPSDTKKPTEQYAIQYKGQNVLVSTNFDSIKKWDTLFGEVSQDKDNRTLDITFTQPGYYTIKTVITDELGVQDTATKTIYVNGEPEPPTAIINSSDYTFVNYPFPVKESSTDPNNDIITWKWDAVAPATEETTGTVSGQLKDAAYPVEGKRPTDIGGTLQFSAPGEYKIGLTVTDATDLSNHAEKTIKVIRDIPVAIVEPGPDSKTNPSDSDPHYAIDTADNVEKIYVKQNRKVVLDATSSLDPPASPIEWDKTEWVYNQSDSDEDFDMTTVKVDDSSTKQKQVFLAKEAGEFQITLTLHNQYSDNLSADDPDLSARTKVLIVKVVPDEDPLTAIKVDNANPNFHDNPQSVEVSIVGTATSPDNDFIDYYNWRVYRDNNNDETYSDNELQTRINKTKTSQVKTTVKFETGNTSKFLAQMDAYERFGQETIDKFVSDKDIRHSSSEQEFEVNWRPCISYTMRDFAYVDDTLTVSPLLKDENVESCTVQWTLMKKNAAGEYEAVDATTLPNNIFGDAPIWELSLHGGNIRITKDGYYRLDATITDAEGHSEHFASTEIRIYDVPRAVISDKANYRWNGGAFQFKESRKFTLDGNASYVNDSTGDAKHQLNRALDEWSITPLDGQNAENIYVGATAEATTRLNSTDSTCFNPGKNSFDEVLAILAPGRYRVDYRVTNTYGKRSPITTQEIVIVEDTAPVITGVVEASVKRGSADNGAQTVLSITDLNIKSDDYDIINTNWTIELIYDKANDGFQNDNWQVVPSNCIATRLDTKYREVMDIAVPESNLGKYQFRIYARDDFDQETLPIVPGSKRKETTKVFDTKVDNVEPNGTFSTRSEAKGDVVFAIGDSAVAKDVSNATLTFANRFGAEAGMNIMDVNVEMVETNTIDLNAMSAQAILDTWYNYPGSNIASYYQAGWTVSNNALTTTANVNWTGFLNWTDDAKKTTNAEFEFTVSIGDHPDPQGWTFCTTKHDDGTYSFYALEVNHNYGNLNLACITEWKPSSGYSTHGGPLYHGAIGAQDGAYDGTPKFVGDQGTKGHFIKQASVGKANNYKIKIIRDGNKIQIYCDGKLVIDVVDDTLKSGTYGPYTCSQYTSSFSDITVTSGKAKSLQDAIADVSWRDGSERFVIYVDDKMQEYMDANNQEKATEYAALLSSLLDSNIHLIALGSDTNKVQLNALLSQLNQQGMYYKNNPSDTAMSQAEEFIKRILRKESKDTMYVLVNERLNYNKLYSDYNGDPQWLWAADGDTPYIAEGADGYDKLFQRFQDNPSLLAQKWHYFHNSTYYDNSQGVASFNATSENDDKWMAHEVNVFDKVGKYEVDYRIKDNPVPDKSDNSPGNPFHDYRYWSQDYAANKTDSTGHVTNPHAVIYVHRRPLAEYDFAATKVNDVVDSVHITNKAYDLDHEFHDANKGLNLYEWKWKFAGDSGWRGEATFDSASEAESRINSQLTNLREQGTTNILVQYRVRDIDGPAEVETLNITHKTAAGWKSESDTTVRNQGAWSLPSVHWITNAAQPPVARFDTNNTVFGLGENVTVTDRSYSPNGDNIIKWEWTIERSTGTKTTVSYEIGSNVTSVSQMETLFSNYLTKWIDGQLIGTKSADNSYKVTLVVTDNKPQRLTSDPYSVTVKITPENTAPTVDPPKGNSSLFSNDNPTVYEYVSYDANQTNPYYTYNGRIQKRGTETLDWSLAVDDPDNYDKYGTGNDSNSYKIQFATDRFLKSSRAGVAEGATGVEHKTYDVRTVTKEQAANSVYVAPYSSAQAGNIAWGAYRITASVTDVPNNDSTPKTTELVTNADKKPLHLYVIPKLSLSTPHFDFDGVQDNQVQIPTGESVTISCTTNDRSTGARILYKDGDEHSFRQEMTLVKTAGETSYWTAEFVIPDNLEAEDLVNGEYYYYKVETYTNYGAKNGEETRSKVVDGASPIHILPIKLYDFTITDITDPSVVFGNVATVKDLAYDRNNSENGALMKVGYAFNFELYSKGMKDSDDYVRIRPTFYGYNSGTGRYDMQLDMYYLNEAGEYVLATTSPDSAAASGDDYVLKTREFLGKDIGSLRELKLTTSFRTKVDRNTQKWTARYGVPGTAVFVTKGSALAENSLYLGDVMIRFDIEAMKHGVAKYNYIGKGQWRLERTGGSGTILNTDKAKYVDGDVLVMDGQNNAVKDFETRPVWTKTH